MSWAIAGLAASGILSFLYYRLVVVGTRRLTHIRRVTVETLTAAGKSPKTPESLGLAYERWEMPSFDGTRLVGWWLEGPEPQCPTVILLHGMHMSRALFIGPAKELRDRGFHVFLPDLRAHGESEGRGCTFGDVEARDLSVIIDHIAEKKGVKTVGLWGISLGSIVGLRSVAREPRIRAFVAQSPYTKLTAIVVSHMRRVSKLMPLLLLSGVKARLKAVSGVDADKVDLVAAAAEIEIPLLFVAGENDDEVPVSETEAVMKAARRSPDVQMLVVKNAGHNNIHKAGGEEFWKTISEFFRARLSP